MKKPVEIEAELYSYAESLAKESKMSIEEYVSDILNVAVVEAVEKELRAETERTVKEKIKA
jgi:hypothetical protein